MIIKATLEQAQIPDIQGLIQRYIMLNGGHYFEGGYANYPLGTEGEMLFTHDDFLICMNNGVKIDKGNFAIEKPLSFLDETVPLEFPDSTYNILDEEGNIIETKTRTWKEYAPFHWTNNTNALIRCIHVKYGEMSGNGLSADELVIWYSNFSESFLVKSEWMQKLTNEYPQEEGV